MNTIENRTNIKVRFSEVDSMHIVWHGNFAKFLEDGREAFGKQYKFGYYDIYNQGFAVPIVNMNIDYKTQVKYGDELEITTIFESVKAAKICFAYEIIRISDKKIIAKAKTTQVFLNNNGELQLTNPPFYVEWKKWYLKK